MFSLDGRNALITGAGQNAGAGIARALAQQGALVLVNDIDEDRAEAVANQIVEAGGLATSCVFDVTDLNQVQAELRSRTIDILVNNAGNAGTAKFRVQSFAETRPESWAAPISVNLGGTMNCTHTVLPAMIERGWGRIIGIVSGAGTVGSGMGVAAYSAGKAAAAGLLRSVALEVASTGVTVNSVALGLMDNTGTSDATAKLARSIPTRRLGTPEDVGSLCVYLASPEASWMTGQTIALAGGSITS